MSIPPNLPARGCSANFSLPVRGEDIAQAQGLVDTLDRINRPRLGREIVYRVNHHEFDVRRPVYRWETRPFEEIMTNGFRARPQGNTPNSTYYDLYDFVHNAGAPLQQNRPIPHAFVSTTLDNGWRPNPCLTEGQQIQLYRYEIYAPGGIWVAVTLRGRYHYPNQAEVTFVGGIAPQYIRSAQIHTFTRPPGSRFPRSTTEARLIINRHFRPHQDVHFAIHTPLAYYLDANRTRQCLPEETYPRNMLRRRNFYELSLYDEDEVLEWYSRGVVDHVPIFINAAFRSSRKNEAYVFMNNEYASVNYAPGTTNDWIVIKPLLISDGYPSLKGTPFGEHGIDCAFDTDRNEAYIFSGNLCAHIDYAPHTTDDKILSGPMSITNMFPCLKDTVFEKGIDAAFRSSIRNEAYIFTGDKYARINYSSKSVNGIKTIRDGYSCLVGTVFETGIDAAFASHRKNEAYIFKGEYYALINFAPGTYDDYLISGKVKLILDHWPSLRSILPRKNGRFNVDYHEAQPQQPHIRHDEL